MKKILLYIFLLFFLFSCNRKKEWTQRDREEYMRSCITSALKTYEEKNLIADTALVIELCKCAGKVLEKKDNRHFTKEELKRITEECSKKLE